MAKIAVFGTGIVGRTLAARLTETGNQVMVGTRNLEETLARTEGALTFKDWLTQNSAIQAGNYSEAAAFGEIVVNCTQGHGSINALSAAGDALNGKIIVDLANPLDFSNGFPPTLWVCNDNSLGEEIQKAFPAAKVVKTLNTMNAGLMVRPSLLEGAHSVFMSGNDDDAKATVRGILNGFGWANEQIIDLGDITTARGTEMILPIWVRLYGALKTPMFNFNINLGK